MRRTDWWLLGALMIACSGAAPATAPAPPDIGRLIARLGDPSFHARKQATQALQHVGKAAIPALQEAVQTGEPEVRLRAQEILRTLEQRPVPDKPFDTDDDSTRLTIGTENGAQSIDVDDAGQKIRIRESPEGIEMTVTGEVDFQSATETYHAKNAQELKETQPEAYKLYEKWSTEIGATFGAGRGVRQVNIRNGPIVLNPGMSGADDLATLRHRLINDMRDAKLPREQMRQVVDAWARVRQERDGGARGQVDSGDRQMARYNRACDNLRKVLADLHLPDPGDALPPPEGARLGVQAIGGFDDNAAVTIGHVMPGSRAAKIGLLPGDVIEVVNGRDVHGVKDLRRLVTENMKGLVVEGTRNGRKLRLEEKQ